MHHTNISVCLKEKRKERKKGRKKNKFREIFHKTNFVGDFVFVFFKHNLYSLKNYQHFVGITEVQLKAMRTSKSVEIRIIFVLPINQICLDFRILLS